jgi:hypothetical protein
MAQGGECVPLGWLAGRHRQYWKRREGSGSRANPRVMHVSLTDVGARWDKPCGKWFMATLKHNLSIRRVASRAPVGVRAATIFQV